MRIDVTIRIVFNDDNIEYVPQYKYDNTTIRYDEYVEVIANGVM